MEWIKCSGECPKPIQPITIQGCEGYETFKIDDQTLGLRPKWIKCSDRIPELEDDYLTYVMDNGCSYRQEVQRFYKTSRVLKGIYGDSSSHWELTTWDDNICIAWMPLPSPPKE